MVVLAKTFDLIPKLGQVKFDVPRTGPLTNSSPLHSFQIRRVVSVALRFKTPIGKVAQEQVNTAVRELLHPIQAVAVEDQHSCVVSRRKFRLTLFVGTGVDFNNETPSTPASQFPPLAQSESSLSFSKTRL